MVRERVAAIIIKDKKILLVKDKAASHIYPPGGSVENNETHKEALERELMEELRLKLERFEPYISFDLVNVVYNEPQIDYCYLVSISGEPIPDSEICHCEWFSKEQILSEDIEIPDATRKYLISKLFKDNLL